MALPEECLVCHMNVVDPSHLSGGQGNKPERAPSFAHGMSNMVRQCNLLQICPAINTAVERRVWASKGSDELESVTCSHAMTVSQGD